MTGVAGTGPVRALPDVMDRGIPVIRKGVEMLHADACFHKGIPNGRDYSQRSDFFQIPGIVPQQEIRSGFGAGSFVTAVTITVLTAGMAAVTAHFSAVDGVRGLRQGIIRFYGRVTIRTGRPVPHLLLGQILVAIAVQFPFLVAIKADHPLLIMNIRRAAVFPGKFRIDAPAVAEGAGLAFVLLNEFMALNEPATDPGNRRRFYMAPATGGVAAAAGLLEDLVIEYLELRLGKSRHYPLPLANRRVVQGFSVGVRDLSMTLTAGFQIVRRTTHHGLMGKFFSSSLIVAFMAGDTALG